ncbi:MULTISPECIES: SLATT domain-containing protein [Pectobacterium]|uniref:SLATT domain-containing protein n=1 Tax=Pectobacterium TaxID=122277 RepID=UPI001CF5E79B|nr:MULTISPECIES: SLATT domain-containing protein [Pectobacterium]MCA6969648.1 SLATT domain-containing protein [Pectobacterium carotovorum]MDY4335788.1 SLATT domain-containing protein [Pectobacterium brasiliense]UPY96801.1 SLATT domain-containing protein [Pectobacterium sp. 21LCBS03]
MNREAFLKSTAEIGYNVGIGCKKHWATLDIVDKVPGFIGFISMAVGIFALVIDELSAKIPSAIMLIFGICAIYISYYDHKKPDYEKAAQYLTKTLEKLRDLYREVQSSNSPPTTAQLKRLDDLRNEYYQHCLSKQILFSDWYAHYKFFWQHQISWMDEQLKFRFFRDKLPLSLMVWCVIGCIGTVYYLQGKTILLVDKENSLCAMQQHQPPALPKDVAEKRKLPVLTIPTGHKSVHDLQFSAHDDNLCHLFPPY